MSIIDHMLKRPSRKTLNDTLDKALGDRDYWSSQYSKVKLELNDTQKNLKAAQAEAANARKERDTYRNQRDTLAGTNAIANYNRANYKKEVDRLTEALKNKEATEADLLGQITRLAEETSKLEVQIERIQKSIEGYIKQIRSQSDHIQTLRRGIYDAISRLLTDAERAKIQGQTFKAEELITLLESSLTNIIDAYNSVAFMVNMTEEEKRAAFVAFQGGVNSDPRFKHFAVMILFESLKQSLIDGQVKVAEVGVGKEYIVRISKTEDRDLALQNQADFAEALEILDDRLAIMNCPNLTDSERAKVEGVVERAIEVMNRCRLAEQQNDIDRAQNEAMRKPEPEAVTQGA